MHLSADADGDARRFDRNSSGMEWNFGQDSWMLGCETGFRIGTN